MRKVKTSLVSTGMAVLRSSDGNEKEEQMRDIGDSICEALVSGASRNAELVKQVNLMRTALSEIKQLAIKEPSYVNAIAIELLAEKALRVLTPATGTTSDNDALTSARKE